MLAGFTITNGSSSGNGGGILANNGAIGINNCIVAGNTSALSGGGIYIVDGKLTLTDCTFTGNSAGDEGGGVATDLGKVVLTGCTFTENSAGWGGAINNSHCGATATNCTFSLNSAALGGAINTDHLYLGDLILTNCTFNGNIADNYGGAVNNRVSGTFVITNCIFWGDLAYREGPEISHNKQGGTVSISYSCLQGGQLDVYAPSSVLNWLSGNITTDPCFTDEAGGDYHLCSTAGRWNPNTSLWTIDGTNSLCIDAGNPDSNWKAELWPHGKRINIGAYGGTAQASLSLSTVGNIADLNNDNRVDLRDFSLFSNTWYEGKNPMKEDLDRDGLVGSNDLSMLVQNWLWSETE